MAFPRIQGGDIAGRIVAVGKGVSLDRIGERVLVDPALYETDRPEALPTGLLGSERDGGFAEYVAVPAANAHDVTGSPLSDVELAALPIAYGTAMGMTERAGLEAGHRVAITGASGGVGLAAIQIALSRGARVVAITSEEKRERLLALDVERVVLRDSRMTATQLAYEVGHIDALLDVVAGPMLPDLLRCLVPGGQGVIAGAIGGPRVELDVRDLYLDQRRLVGSTLHTPRQFALLTALARRGTVRPPVVTFRGLDAFAQAQAAFLRRRHIGKLIIEVALEDAM